MAFAWWEAITGKKAQSSDPAVTEVKTSSRPGVGSDPAPYLPDNERGLGAQPREPVQRQWARLGRGSGGLEQGAKRERHELLDDRRYRRTLYAAPITDDNHTEPAWKDDPYIENPPQPIRRRLVQSSFRELNKSAQTFGAHGQKMNGDGADKTMATQRRTFPIGGMTPVVRRRNTWRLQPPPLDINASDTSAAGTKFDVPDQTTTTRIAGPAVRGVKMLR